MVERVLQVTYAMNRGGAETLVMNVLRHIDRSKVIFDFLENDQTEGDKQYDQEIRNLGGRIYRAPKYITNPIRYARFCDEFFEEHHEYHIVHGHFMKAAAPVYLESAKKHGRFTIAHSHNTKDGNKLKDAALRVLRYPVRNIADEFFACSEDAGKYAFGKKIVESDHFKVIKNGIDVNKFSSIIDSHDKAKHDLGFADNIVVGNVGRLYPQKNQRFLLEVFRQISQQRPDAVLLILGDGILRTELEEYARQLGISEKVVFLGSVEDTSIYYSAMDLFIFPSLFEGLSLSMLEAQAAGLPLVISSTIPKDNILCNENIQVCSLSDSPKRWADIALGKLKHYVRKEQNEKIIQAGYDINEVAKSLSEFYLSHA